MAIETKKFETEINQLFDIMVHSLYSQREIFLRELISNASDALDKRRLAEAANPELASQEEMHIRLIADPKNHTLIIRDNGIGMTYEEAARSLGTVAYSGTREFLQKAKEMKDKPELIGQFGVGFYSAFMVAERVTVHTRKAGSGEGTVWESTGDGSYTMDKVPRDGDAGTTITLKLKSKPADAESEWQDFTDEWTLRSIVRKYSDFIQHPIKMVVTKEEPVRDAAGKAIEGKFEKVEKDETLNVQKALWLRPAKEIKKDEYAEFYKHLSHDWTDPLDVLHYRAEGTQEFAAMIFIPGAIPFDYNQRGTKYGLNLYVKRVFITDNCEELLPQYLRFLKGVVDSTDLPLNISRELIQKDRQIVAIRKALVGKIIRFLENMLEKDRTAYQSFFDKFGSTLKEGVPSDHDNKGKIQDLLLFRSSHSDAQTTLKEYVTRMKAEQKAIYYIVGENVGTLASSPYLEKLRVKGFEVLYLTDTVDEWVMSGIREYDGKPVESITRENLDLDSEEEKKASEKELKSQQEKLKPLTEFIQKTLDESVKEVKVTDRLIDSPVCLVSGTNDPSAHMERIMEAMGQHMPKSKRILEINPNHPVFAKMMDISEDRKKGWAEILYNQALLNEGSPIKDPVKFSRQISELMVEQ